ncbi:MAG TPA: M48 family metalloprotease [Streptosporangiaceae bacterium]|nr:M48 family metalloprotease [Streptosporangiaceae bacterium]
MIVLGLVPFACSVLLALTAGRLGRRLSPAAAAPLLTLAALATSLATGMVLCLAAFTALARDPLVASLGGWPDDRARPWAELPAGWGIAAAALAGALLASAVVYVAHVAWDLAGAHRACRQLTPAGDQLMITPEEHPAAFTLPVPLRRGAIVVSAGMLRLLPADERRALLAHESAHLRRYHSGYVLLAALAAAANPLLRPVARQVRLAVELWADQLAAHEVGDARVVARALARASLAASRPQQPGGFRLAVAESDISARVHALTQLPPPLRPWAAASVLVLAVAASAIAVTLALAVHNQMEIAQFISAHTVAMHHPRSSTTMSVVELR